VFCFQFVYVEHLPMYQLNIETKWVTGKNKDQAVTPPYLIQWFLLHSVHTKGISPCWRQLFKEHLLLFFGLPITRLLQPLRMCLSTYRAREWMYNKYKIMVSGIFLKCLMDGCRFTANEWHLKVPRHRYNWHLIIIFLLTKVCLPVHNMSAILCNNTIEAFNFNN